MESNDWIDWILNQKYAQPVSRYKRYKDRRNSALYRVKKRLVKNIWLVSGVFMLANPSLPMVIGTTLFTAFISFSILDETS